MRRTQQRASLGLHEANVAGCLNLSIYFPAKLFPMSWTRRQYMVFTGAPLAIIPALLFLPALAYLVITPSMRHATVVAIILFPLSAILETLGVYRLVRCCVSPRLDLLSVFAAGTLLVLLVIATYTGFFLAAIAGLF